MKMQELRTPILELTRFPKPVCPPPATRAEALVIDREAVRIVGEMRSNWHRLGPLIQEVIDA